MKICSLQIENFGKLHGFSLDLSDGLTTVCEENGWGKSTLAAFIKAMFYGLPRTRAQSLDDNERKKYAPWQGGTYGGNLVFECTRGKFRVERVFGDPDEFNLVDLSSGLRSAAFSEDLGQELFGVDADGFERSTYLSARPLAPTNTNSTLNAKLTGILEEVHDMGNFDRAFKVLDDRAREYKKNGARGKIGEIETRMRERNEELRTRRRKLDDLTDRQEALAAEQAALDRATAEYDAARNAAVRAEQVAGKQRMEQGIARMEAQKIQLEGRYEGPVPTAAEMTVQRALLREIEAEEAGLQASGPDAGERAEAARLSTMFPNGAPDEESLRPRKEAASQLRDDRVRLATERDLAAQSLQAAQNALQNLPDADEVQAARDRLESARGSAPEIRPAIPKFLFIAALALALGGIVGLVAGILSRSLPVIAVGGAALVAALLCPVFGILSGRGKKENADAREAERAARALLERARYAAGNDPLNALRALADEIGRAEADAFRAEKRLEELQSAGIDLRNREADLRAFLAGYGISGNDPETDLDRLSECAKTYTRLLQKQRDSEERRTGKQTALREKSAAIEQFFARRRERPAHLDRNGMMDLMGQESALSATLAAQIADQRGELRELIAEKNLEENDGPAADPAALNERITALNERLQGLRARVKDLTISVDRLSRETEPIPEIEEEIDRLKEEKTDLEKRYRLLTITRDLLKEARDSLTTRYLEGTRRNFEKYLAAMAGEKAPAAEVDATFTVTVLDSGMSRVLNAYSRGWRDILQFCVRLAVVDELYAGSEAPFLLLDDPFTNLDEERLAFAKTILGDLSRRYQVLYLVCHEDRA